MIAAHRRLRSLLIASILLMGACNRGTAELTPDQEARFQAEGIVRRADDVEFRYTRDPGGRSERREDRRASIIVTKSTVLIHKNEKLGLEITPRTRRETAVERSGERIRVRSGRGQSEEIWSFVPPSDPTGWASDLRAVIGASSAGKRK